MESIRNKLGWGLSGALALLLLAALAGVVHGGPLDPTAPPGSTGKNVITSLPFGINQPGSYVLNSNLTGVSGQNGITIIANNVTIDLQGFELVGTGGSFHGIAHSSGSVSGLTVRNGTIRNWGMLGISSGPGLRVDAVTLKDNNGGVIGLDGATLTNCRVEGSVGSAVILGNRSVVSKCTSDSNGPGCNTCPGIQVGTDSTVTETIASNNGGREIVAGDRSTLENCVANGAGGTANGIDVGADAIIRGCTATNNGAEIVAGDRSLIESCVADGWTGSARGPGGGIVVTTASIVRGCSVVNNGNGGVVALASNRIEGNHVRANSINGILVSGSANTVLQNDSASNGSNSVTDNCADTGSNDFEKKTSATAAGAFDNLCD